MKDKKVNAFISKLINSSMVNKITGGNLNPQTNAFNSYDMKMYNFKKKSLKDKLVLILGILFIILVFAGIVYLLFFRKEEKPSDNKNKSLYELAYETMGFKENPNLEKLHCEKISSESGEQVSGLETIIYYFKDNDVDTMIQHLDIVVKDEYMDYYDQMYKSYDDSLEKNYKYDNVDTNLTKGDKELLTTVIIYNNKNVENKLSTPKVTNIEDAKKTYVDAGFSCK